MAYRRRHGISRSSTFKEETNRSRDGDATSSSSAPTSPIASHTNRVFDVHRNSPLSLRPRDRDGDATSSSAPTSPLASQAHRVSDVHRNSPLSSGFINSAFNSAFQQRSKERSYILEKRGQDIQDTWNYQNKQTETKKENQDTQDTWNFHNKNNETKKESQEIQDAWNCLNVKTDRKKESQEIQDAWNCLNVKTERKNESQEIQDAWNWLNVKTERNHEDLGMQNQRQDGQNQSAQQQTNHEHQLKASRDVAIATAAKAKLLLREIKTLKADLAFAKQRSSQLEEENKMLREACEKGDHPADDDMIRLQLETLLAEKSRLANENSVYARENSCLREIIEYHKLTMQDVVYLDEVIEEVAEVNPGISRTLSVESGSLPLPSTKETSASRVDHVPTGENPSRPGSPTKGSVNHAGT